MNNDIGALRLNDGFDLVRVTDVGSEDPGRCFPQVRTFDLRVVKVVEVVDYDDGIATITAELDENSGIRLLSASDSDNDREQACRRAADLLAGIDNEQRPLAALTAQLLLVETLRATGRSDDADALRPDVAARCEEHGLSRLLVDAGLG